MKNIIAFIFIGFMIISCGSTNEAEIKKPVVEEGRAERRTSDQPKRKPNFDPEQMVAQLGLSEEKSEEFLVMWETTDKAMRKVRKDHKGDRDMLRKRMGEVKAERDQGLRDILTLEQLQNLYDLMKKNNGGIKAKRQGKNGI